MKKSAKLRQPSPVNPDLLLAINLQEQGLVDEAETLFKACLEANASDALALYSLGVIFLNRREVDAALHVMDRGIKAAPRYSPMWFGHGMVLTAAGRSEEALVSYQQAIAIDPRNINAMIN
ncbi:MAG: tetratricopeptide repeat protein, partial [Betaproteobacteria bacterium]|nr:tetratricopeptide repeat protein [Betaproteobacteria bacterium]